MVALPPSGAPKVAAEEKIKIEKEPLKFFMENVIEELGKIPIEEIDQSKHTKDDIDVRLKWLGLFHKRKNQFGRFMMRLRLPNAVTSAQTRYLASVKRKYRKGGCADYYDKAKLADSWSCAA